jgi:hypothetical protein
MPYKNAEDRRSSRLRVQQRALQQMLADAEDQRHGTITGYSYGCRCAECTRAVREHHRAWSGGKARQPLTHGTPTMYTNHGCRCESCTAANTEKKREYRMRRKADEL